MTYTAPKGDGKDTVEDLTWLPSQMKDNAIQPENMRSFGAAWTIGLSSGSWANSYGSIPYDAIGGFYIALQGQFLLVSWPNTATLDLGISASESIKYLMSLSLREFLNFATTHFWHMPLEHGKVAWTPYGWQSVLIAKDGQSEHSYALRQSVVSPKLLNTCDARVKGSIMACASWWSVNTVGQRPHGRLLPAMKTWLEDHGCVEPGTTQAIAEDDDADGSADDFEDELEREPQSASKRKPDSQHVEGEAGLVPGSDKKARKREDLD